jgi:hypothetical protein
MRDDVPVTVIQHQDIIPAFRGTCSAALPSFSRGSGKSPRRRFRAPADRLFNADPALHAGAPRNDAGAVLRPGRRPPGCSGSAQSGNGFMTQDTRVGLASDAQVMIMNGSKSASRGGSGNWAMDLDGVWGLKKRRYWMYNSYLCVSGGDEWHK